MTYKHTETEEDTYNITMDGTNKSIVFFFIVLILITMAACSPTKGCGEENYKHKFRAKILKIKQAPNGYEVTYRRARNYYTSICSSKPAFKVGDYICLN